jgi:hypothetical protein
MKARSAVVSICGTLSDSNFRIDRNETTGFSPVVTYRRLSSLRRSADDRFRDSHYPARLKTQTGQSTVRHQRPLVSGKNPIRTLCAASFA